MENSLDKEAFNVKKKKIDKIIKVGLKIDGAIFALSLLLLIPNVNEKVMYTLQKANNTNGISLLINRPIKKIDIQLLIKNSNLMDDEKEYLLSGNFINDLTKRVNEAHTDCDMIFEALDGLNIKPMTDEMINERPRTLGCVSLESMNTIYLKDYGNITKERIFKILCHEFIHLFENRVALTGSFIIEPVTEICAQEYYRNCKTDYYEEEIKYTKMLMEIVGPDLIYDLVFTGKNFLLKREFATYLGKEKANEFYDLLTKEQANNDGEVQRRNKKVFDYIKELFENKYGYELHDNLTMGAILQSNYAVDLKRYYFNSEHINDESYYKIVDENALFLEKIKEAGDSSLPKIGEALEKQNVLKME